LIIAGSTNAASYSDADGDGVCEVGEEIAFEGDISYIDEDGNEHFFQSWYWDFDNDGSWEENGRTKTHTFDSTGVYLVKLYEINAQGKLITFEIDVKENNDNPGNDDDDDQDDDDDDDDDDECKHRYRIWRKVKRFLRRHPKYRHRVRWALKHLMKNHRCNSNK
jgi:hypothetical protein